MVMDSENGTLSMLILHRIPLLVALIHSAVASGSSSLILAQEGAGLTFCCAPGNDLYRVLSEMGQKYKRFDDPMAAVKSAPNGTGILVLADGYPDRTTDVSSETFAEAARKKLRLFIEYPSNLPNMRVGKSRGVELERGVATSSVFGPGLAPMDIVMIHDCHFVEIAADKAEMVIAKVAGFDKAVYGLKDTPSFPLLFEHPRGGILVCTTKFSHFVTARYATREAWQAIWKRIFHWLQTSTDVPLLEWTPTVRPAYARDAKLPPNAAREAIQRGIAWHSKARLLIGESWKDEYEKRRKHPGAVGPIPEESLPPGDGSNGLLEGICSRVDYRGIQPAVWTLRSDCNGESALAFALSGRTSGDTHSAAIAANLLDWVYFKSKLYLDDPAKPNYGLLRWMPDNFQALYQDNDVKVMLGCMGTAALQKTDRWDKVLLSNILANFRTTGRLGFRGERIENPDLLQRGWQSYWQADTIRLSPHFEAWSWAVYLWLYDKTKYEPLLERTRNGIRRMMKEYPDNWFWTNGIQQERGRMLLTLAWLIRVEDTAEHRAWLKRIFDDLREDQDPCGAIREELGTPGKGCMAPPVSNAAYGTGEAPLIHRNGDPVADMLYTCNFALLGLHEAAAATDEPQYREAEDKLADFLIRIQVRSEAHPELDGAWFRAFDFTKWDYWGSNADAGWGAWAVECGWTQGWIISVLAMRQEKINLWDLTRKSRIATHMPEVRALMFPDEAPNSAE